MRQQKFDELKNHPYLSKLFKKLKNEDLIFCEKFLEETKALTKDEFATKVIRLNLDNPNKPKAWKEIEELLISSL